MTDRERVIKALEYCAPGNKPCDGCPMKDNCKGTANGAMAAAIKLLKEQTPEMPAQLAHDLETVAKVRAGKVCKAMNSAYVIWSIDYYEREMERVRAVLGAVQGAGHSERDPEGVQRERTEPDGP